MESSSSSSSSAASAEAGSSTATKPTQAVIKDKDVKLTPPQVDVCSAAAAAAGGVQPAKKSRIQTSQKASSSSFVSAFLDAQKEQDDANVRKSPRLQQQSQKQEPQQKPETALRKVEAITIVVKLGSLTPLCVKILKSTSVRKLHDTVGKHLGMCPSTYRLFYDGAHLLSGRSDRTIGDLEMEDGNEIHGAVQQIGSIGIWRAPDNVHPFLLNPPVALSPTLPPKDDDLALLVTKLTKGQREDLTGTTVLDEQLERIMEPSHCKTLRQLLDQRHQLAEVHNSDNVMTTDANTTDYKLYLTFSELCQHIGNDAATALSSRIQDDYTYIALRRCKPQGHCIDFHLDRSEWVLQVALNSDDEYEGGRLIFATSDGVLLTPQRKEGTATLHNCTVVHGVSAHTKGVRYGLFFIKEPSLLEQPQQ